MDLKRINKKTDILYCVVFLLTALFMFWRIHQGLGSTDEHFYITEGYRLYSGDRLFVDDWHIAQMISVFLAPLISISHMLSPDFNGVVLQFRAYYIVFTLLIGLLIYLRFRKEYGRKAIAASLIYMLFTPFQIHGLSYNTMGPGFLILAMLCWPEEGNNPIRVVFFGIFMACSVLNMPYLIFLYLILSVLAICKHPSFTGKQWLYTTIGALLVAFVFIGFVLSQSSVQELQSGLPHLIDPSHSDSLFMKLAKNGGKLLIACHIFLIAYIVEIVLAIRYKKRKSLYNPIPVSLWINLASMIVFSFITRYEQRLGGYAVILLPYAVIGLLILITEECNNYLKSCYYASLFLAITVSFSSNVGPSSFLCPLIFACSITSLLLKQIPIKKEYLTIGFIALLIWFKGTEDFLGNVQSYNTVATVGPLKGLKGTEQQVLDYEARYEDMNQILSYKPDNVALISWANWGYFAINKPIASNSTYLYFWDRESYVAAEEQYKAIHTDRYPAYVYVDENNPYFKENDEWINTFETVTELNRGTLYIRR